MKNIITTFLLVFSISLHAQVVKTIHQTFELGDEVENVTLDIYDEVEVEEWAGNAIMLVTKVELISGPQHLLDFYVREGRYDVETNGDEETSLTLVSMDKVRKGMIYKHTTVTELVKIKMRIPENYKLNGDNQLVKKNDETVMTEQKDEN